ncbi:MAG: Druantia anti-phage system protein DruA [Bacillota bacterium]
MKAEAEFQVTRITEEHILTVQRLIADNPSWSRTRLSMELCHQMKDMACRDLLLKLEQQGQIVLPRRKSDAFIRGGHISIIQVPHDTTEITDRLKDLLPLRVEVVETNHPSWGLFKCLLYQYHYLGFSGTVGENMKYLVYDRLGRPLACLLFGSAAWSCAARDDFIGWDSNTRINHLHLVTNNTRFLILPWVRVPHLASHILGLITWRIINDWQRKYGHGLLLLETFVEIDRFWGTCYKAANWRCVGLTKGRSRKLEVPVKAVYLYPLVKYLPGRVLQ